MDSSVSQILILLVLLLLSGIFSSAETALTTYNKIRMRALADEGNKRASAVLAVTENSGKMLSAILIGNNLVNNMTASLATAFAIKFFGNGSVGIFPCHHNRIPPWWNRRRDRKWAYDASHHPFRRDYSEDDGNHSC